MAQVEVSFLQEMMLVAQIDLQGVSQDARIVEAGSDAQAGNNAVIVEVVHVEAGVAVERRFFPAHAGGEAEVVVQVILGSDAGDENVVKFDAGLVSQGV